MTALTVQSYLAAQYRAELEMFTAALDALPDDAFTTPLLSHSAAWHTLHVADWLRLMVLDDQTPDYHYLGWEDNTRVQALGTQPAPLEEDAPRAEIMARLEDIGARAAAWLDTAQDSDLDGEVFSAATASGTRPRVTALGMQLRHVAYHRGQVQLGKKSR